MSSLLSGKRIAVLGGDDRELILISELVKRGAILKVAGFPSSKLCDGASAVNSVEDACRDAKVVILPLPGTSLEGIIRAVYAGGELKLSEKAVAVLADNALLIIGSARPFLKEWVRKYSLRLIEITEMDDIAIMNSIPTAEGAIQIAMEESKITIHGSRSLIIGFGRIAITLARTLRALGSDVTVVARNEGQMARAYEMGCKRAHYSELTTAISNSNFVFNTVPSMVLSKSVLRQANCDALIIDLATQPGGTDFEAANEYGFKAILAPGLPGKVAPISAGKILAELVPRLIIKELGKMGQNLVLE
ncbi:MAG: dipicolinate synthase subunit DpsA [Syntrophomonas sp.]|uniref:dipicolinate synthase subunit DpsA n=1 Tax=Syntrophomonas sp. TaxID=2053627 RepID=UPI00260CEA86|nr:dipicolinate synthase subunit DpsA [Syntrophomonas sp.]MDD2509687.1 dipicolinate synthase subunit DpsA [Syntrophomonas sp.]MDD4625819.1 dipicolinate synthase subunit DpsA [Syntrophomonas sp.]